MFLSKLYGAILVALSWSGIARAQHIVTMGVRDGVNAQSGARPFRQNILNLKEDPYAWPLYIQALTYMANASENEPTSFFQIAGIHGRPYAAWDNVHGPVDYPTGYCTHNSILFPTWHRPYLALFEQALSAHAQAIAQLYTSPDKAQYEAAAKTLRMPYWDWAAIPTIPDVVTASTLNINTPQGVKSIDNPLFRYRFPYRDPKSFPTDAGDGFLAQGDTTTRNPSADDNLANGQLMTNMYNILTHVRDFATFATQGSGGPSLEAIHGEVHIAVGGGRGHMSYLSYAGFDPIFWLHHTNVDRLFALFQATHPTWWFPTAGHSNNDGTFTIASGTTEYSNTSLTPFSQDASGAQWDSDGSRGLAPFGYSYPEIEDWHQTPTELANNVTAQINAMYNPSGTSQRREVSRDTTIREWFVSIAVRKFALNTTFVVEVFLGDPPANPAAWKTAPNFVSLVVVFRPSGNMPTETMTYGEIPLKKALEDAGLANASPTAVADYLTKKLQWRIQRVDGTVVDASLIPSLKVRVTEEEVTLPRDEHSFPKYGAKTDHPKITIGKAGGA